MEAARCEQEGRLSGVILITVPTVEYGGPGGPGPGGPGPQSLSYDGALSISSQSYTPPYTASTGWNLATGLGTVDAYKLVAKWNSAR
jgi:hypothetical protein